MRNRYDVEYDLDLALKEVAEELGVKVDNDIYFDLDLLKNKMEFSKNEEDYALYLEEAKDIYKAYLSVESEDE